ncbi:RDD family protein [Pontibacter sp. E15-1]|uniref:RDD family protein n=1 Tax=Pontibacter sp. E15-1 TaxID=2919918 RepID=UPI001F501817|nr:RDD family protein [Pontibacter sp. E15-1]MCJ8165360.1 RDD family protein [Pontibacter sp. E15-1]
MQVFSTTSDSKEELASLSKRLMALALDVLLILALVGIADMLTFSSDDQALLLKPERLLHLLLGWLYFAGAESCTCQGTLGKYLLGLRVTSATGQRIGFKAASVRYFAKPITLLTVLLRFLSNGTPNTGIPFHDALSKSRVVLR